MSGESPLAPPPGPSWGVPADAVRSEDAGAVPDRVQVLYRSLAAGAAFIAVLWAILPDRAARMMLDYPSSLFPFPVTIQNLEHLGFFVALGELWVRRAVSQRELAFLAQGYLPEDDATVLQAHDLGPIRRRVAKLSDGEHGFLPGLIDLCVLQFQASRSVDQTVSVLNSSLELIAHRVDLRYQMLRYLAWFIPTVGFLGTVIGIGSTLALIPKSGDPELYAMGQNLTVAFDTTIVALAESAIVVFAMNVIQADEERSVSQAGTYCLRNLINRLYEPRRTQE